MYQKFGWLFIIAVITTTLLLSGYLSICVFCLNGTMSYVVIVTALFIVGFICHHYTTANDQRKQSKADNSSYGAAAIHPVCCPVCGIHNIRQTGEGDYGCIDCGLKWRQTY